METFDQRLQRFKNNSPIEFIETILNAMYSGKVGSRLWELEVAAQNQLSDLLILGIHACIETISENIFLKKGIEGFKFYLENFVDTNKEGFRFSEIADELNDWRNIVAHQYISRLGHSFGYNYSILTGYQVENGTIIINPKIFFDQFRRAFINENVVINGNASLVTGGKTKRKIWDYQEIIANDKIKEAKTKFLEKFENR
jgi:hypothetical protein